MQGQKVVKKTAIGLFKVILYLCLFVVVGYISYRVTLALGNGSNKESLGNQAASNNIVTARADAVALNLVFGVDEQTAEVQSIVLEIFNSNTKNIDLITIPASTKVTMSQELYTKISNKNPNVPQIITLSDIGKYFDQEDAYQYATLIVNEFLNTNISFYSALLKTNFDKYFTENNGMYTLRSSQIATWKKYTNSKEYLDALIDYYQMVQSNLKLSDRKAYISSYMDANYNYIHTYLISEEYVEGRYVLNSEQSSLLESIMSYDKTYTSSKESVSDVTENQSSKGANIQVLNGTTVSGLAAKYKTTLTEAGYTIGSVGNYTGGSLQTTKIIVREDGMGADLKKYFTDPVIQTGTIDGGYDILIILGSKDA